jgi:hypothetical protein
VQNPVKSDLRNFIMSLSSSCYEKLLSKKLLKVILPVF